MLARSRLACVWAALGVIAGLGGCGSDQDGETASEPICTPGTTRPCLGADGCDGTEVCSSDGSSWGVCECEPLGTGGAAATGGADGSGGSAPTGGTSSSDGRATGGDAAGGTDASGGLGGVEATGGSAGAGGVAATGGSTSGGAGGAANTGGSTSATGGVGENTGGSGGADPTGGSGGADPTGGSGGAIPTAGSAGTSGSGGAGGTRSLNDYVRTAEPIALPGLSECSGVTYQPETDTFFIVANTSHQLYEFSADFATLLRTISLDNGPTDTEDVACLGDNRFAIVVEDNEVYVVTIAAGAQTADLGGADVERYVVAAPPATMNLGFEGVAWQPGVGTAGQFFVCQEGGQGVPIRVLSFLRASAAGTYSYLDQTLSVQEPWDAATALGSEMADLSSITFDPHDGTLLILSHESSLLVRVAPQTGAILEQRSLEGSPQYEGITLANDDRLVIVSEPNWVEVYQLN